jgi:hypothetical protein
MKIRTGFVSNSSSSSFCLYGVYITDPEKFALNYQELIIQKQITGPHWFTSESQLTESDLEDFFNYKDLQIFEYFKSGLFYLGQELEYMEDNETFGGFKTKIRNQLDELKCLGFVFEHLDIHKYGWHDG